MKRTLTLVLAIAMMLSVILPANAATVIPGDDEATQVTLTTSIVGGATNLVIGKEYKVEVSIKNNATIDEHIPYGMSTELVLPEGLSFVVPSNYNSQMPARFPATFGPAGEAFGSKVGSEFASTIEESNSFIIVYAGTSPAEVEGVLVTYNIKVNEDAEETEEPVLIDLKVPEYVLFSGSNANFPMVIKDAEVNIVGDPNAAVDAAVDTLNASLNLASMTMNEFANLPGADNNTKAKDKILEEAKKLVSGVDLAVKDLVVPAFPGNITYKITVSSPGATSKDTNSKTWTISAMNDQEAVNATIAAINAAAGTFEVAQALAETEDQAKAYALNLMKPYIVGGTDLEIVGNEWTAAVAEQEGVPGEPGQYSFTVKVSRGQVEAESNNKILNITPTPLGREVLFYNGGVQVKKLMVPFGKSVSEIGETMPVVTNDGYVFQGWYTSSTNKSGTLYTATTKVPESTEPLKLYAIWEKIGGDGPSGPSGPSGPGGPVTSPSPSQPSTTPVATASPAVISSNDIKTTNGVSTAKAPTTSITNQINTIQTSDVASVVTIDMSNAPKNSSSYELTLTSDDHKAIKDANAGLAVKTPVANVTFDTVATGTIDSAAEGDVKLSVAVVDKATLAETVSEEELEKIGDRPVFDFTVTKGDTTVSDFKGGTATISIPYTPSANENKDALVVYYISDSGELKTVRGYYDEATGSVVIQTSHFSKYAIAYNLVTFTDVASSAWYKSAVDFAAARGLVDGLVSDDKFIPDQKMTRGEFLVIMMRGYAIELDPTADNFDDAEDDIYAPYMATAKKLGIAAGTGTGNYEPDREITRQEMMTLVYNALKAIDELPAVNSEAQEIEEYDDAEDIAAWALAPMTALVESETIVGTGNNKLSPLSDASRGELVQVVKNLLTK